MAKNKVIAGAYEGWDVVRSFGIVTFHTMKEGGMFLGKTVYLDGNITHYEILDENSTKSASSAIIRGGLGAVLLGPIGLLAGFSAKNNKVKLIALKFKDGQECVVDVDDKIFQIILKYCHNAKSSFDDMPVSQQIEQKISEADEIMKFKDLLDKGIITQEEFNAKKKEIFKI